MKNVEVLIYIALLANVGISAYIENIMENRGVSAYIAKKLLINAELLDI